jgi:hypothetical protein
VTVLGGLGIIFVWVQHRARLRELMIRERIALIERGILPPPERDPGGFEAMTGPRPASPAALRFRSLGVTLVGLGLALMVLIAVAGGAPEVGIGVGGAVALVGAAAVVNSALMARGAPGQIAGSRALSRPPVNNDDVSSGPPPVS